MHSLPLFLRLRDKVVLVVGAGPVALRRVDRLLAAGASVRLVAPQAAVDIESTYAGQALEWLRQPYAEEYLQNAALVIAATDESSCNANVVAQARARGIPAQRSDNAEDSDFFFPAIIDRSPLVIALSTGGGAPALTRYLRTRLDAMLPAGYQDMAALFARYRARAARLGSLPIRRRFWDQILAGPVGEKVFSGRKEEAARDIEALLDAPSGQTATGEVYLVGAGPGAPDLLTLRALRLMQQSDVVLYDALVAPAIVDMVRPEAQRMDVGKRASRHTLPQEGINSLMVRLAREGKRVLRLKGGDPFIFGRGGEEIAELADAGLPFQVVPGITAASGCAAYAGIPLTHRDYAQSVQFITGHLKSGQLALDWTRLVAPDQTLVFYMGLTALEQICQSLREHGLPDSYPAALVQEGTTPRQRVVVGTLADLAQKKDAAQVSGACLLIIGQVVKLNARLGWFRPAEQR